VVDFSAAFYRACADDSSRSEQFREAAMMFCVAEGQIEDSFLEEAMAAAENSLELFRDCEDARGVRDALRLVVHVHRAKADEARNRGERSDARILLEKAEALAEEELSNFRDADDNLGQAAMLLSMAETACAYRGSSKRDEALENAEEARELFHQAKDVKMEALAAQTLAEVNFRKRNFHAGRRMAVEATELFKSIGDKIGMAIVLHLHAAIEARSEVVEQAIRHGRKSLKLLQEVGSKPQQMAALVSLGQWYLMREDTQAVLSVGETALALLQELDKPDGWQAPAIGFIVEAHILNNDTQKAVDKLQKALSELRDRGGKNREMVHLMHHLIHAHAISGDMAAAKEAADDALVLAKEIGCRRLQSHVHEELAHGYLVAEDFDSARETAKEAVVLLKDLGADFDEITTRLQVLVKVLIVQEDYQEALRNITIARDLAVKIDEKPLEAFCLSVQSRVQALLGDTGKGIKAADLALDMFREDGDRRGESRVWEGLSEIHLTAGDYGQALRAAKRAQALCEDIGDQRLTAKMWQTLSSVHLAGEEHVEALRDITEAVKLSRADDDMRGTVRYIFMALDIHIAHLSAMDPEDKSKLRLYRQGCEKAMRLGKEAVGLSIRLSDRYSESMGHYWAGTMHIMMGKPKDAQLSADTALEISMEKGLRLPELYAKSLQAQVCLQEKNHAGAMAKLKEVTDLANELGDEIAKSLAKQLKDLVYGGAGQEAASAQAAAQTAAAAAAAPQAGEAASAAPSDVAVFQGPDPAIMKSHIIAMVKNMTGGGEDEVDGDTPLMETGIDSLASVELRTQLQAEFKINLPSTVMFNYPTIEGLTQLLVDECTQKKITWTG